MASPRCSAAEGSAAAGVALAAVSAGVLLSVGAAIVSAGAPASVGIFSFSLMFEPFSFGLDSAG